MSCHSQQTVWNSLQYGGRLPNDEILKISCVWKIIGMLVLSYEPYTIYKIQFYYEDRDFNNLFNTNYFASLKLNFETCFSPSSCYVCLPKILKIEYCEYRFTWMSKLMNTNICCLPISILLSYNDV